MQTAPNKRERRVLDCLADGQALPSSEFYGVGIETLARMAGKGWIVYSRQTTPDRVVYSITDQGIAACQVEAKRRSRRA